jgi:hypothetical protein
VKVSRNQVKVPRDWKSGTYTSMQPKATVGQRCKSKAVDRQPGGGRDVGGYTWRHLIGSLKSRCVM